MSIYRIEGMQVRGDIICPIKHFQLEGVSDDRDIDVTILQKIADKVTMIQTPLSLS